MTIHIMIPFFRQINTNLVELLVKVSRSVLARWVQLNQGENFAQPLGYFASLSLPVE